MMEYGGGEGVEIIMIGYYNIIRQIGGGMGVWGGSYSYYWLKSTKSGGNIGRMDSANRYYVGYLPEYSCGAPMNEETTADLIKPLGENK